MDLSSKTDLDMSVFINSLHQTLCSIWQTHVCYQEVLKSIIGQGIVCAEWGFHSFPRYFQRLSQFSPVLPGICRDDTSNYTTAFLRIVSGALLSFVILLVDDITALICQQRLQEIASEQTDLSHTRGMLPLLQQNLQGTVLTAKGRHGLQWLDKHWLCSKGQAYSVNRFIPCCRWRVTFSGGKLLVLFAVQTEMHSNALIDNSFEHRCGQFSPPQQLTVYCRLSVVMVGWEMHG